MTVSFDAYDIAESSRHGTIEPVVIDADSPVAELVDAALRQPSGFPSLAQAVVAGDRIAIPVLGEFVPLQPVIAHVIDFLRSHGIREEDVVVLIGPDDDETEFAESPSQGLPDVSSVSVLRHQPSDDKQHGFLAASIDGLAIRFHRCLLDADVVIPISDSSLRGAGAEMMGIFPRYSDLETQQRFTDSNRTKRADEVAFVPGSFAMEATSQLGVFFEVCATAVAASGIVSVMAGDPSTIAARCENQPPGVSCHELEQPAELLLVEPKTAHSEITFAELCQCIARLNHFVADDGTLVIESDLVESRPSLEAEDDEIDGDSQAVFDHVDQAVIDELERVLERIHVVAVGRGYDEEIEGLGIGLAESPQSVRRLASRYQRCVLVRDGLRCRIAMRGVDA